MSARKNLDRSIDSLLIPDARSRLNVGLSAHLSYMWHERFLLVCLPRDYAILLICQRIARHSAHLYLIPRPTAPRSPFLSLDRSSTRMKTVCNPKLTNHNDIPNAVNLLCGRPHIHSSHQFTLKKLKVKGESERTEFLADSVMKTHDNNHCAPQIGHAAIECERLRLAVTKATLVFPILNF